MKYLLKFTKYAAVVVGGVVILNSCDKVKTPDPMGDAGQTLVKIIGGGQINLADTILPPVVKNPVDFVPTPTTLVVADIRRDVANNAELNREMHVTVIDDTAAVRWTDPNYIILPAAWYTIDASTPKTGGVGGVFNLVLAPGEFAKPITITIPDATLLDPSSLYALGFTITTVDADGKIADSRAVVVEIGAKNDYDGVYHITGTLSDVSSVAGANVFGPWAPYWEALLVTTGATTVDVEDNTYTGFCAHPFFSVPASSTASYFGTFGLMLGFNPATGDIIDLHNYYGDPTKPATPGGNPALGSGPPLYIASSTRRVVIDPSGTNKFSAGTHHIDVKYWMLQPSIMGSNNPRIFFNEHWEYVGPR